MARNMYTIHLVTYSVIVDGGVMWVMCSGGGGVICGVVGDGVMWVMVVYMQLGDTRVERN